jgi:hypothetical protein
MGTGPPPPKRLIERRRSKRQPCPTLILCSIHVRPDKPLAQSNPANLLEHDAIVHNISPTGCRLETDGRYPVKQSVELILQRSHVSTPIRITRAIVRWAKPGLLGIQFLDLTPEVESQLLTLLQWLSDCPA